MGVSNNNASVFSHKYHSKRETLGKIQFNISNKIGNKIGNNEDKYTYLKNDIYNVPEIKMDKGSIQNFILSSIPRFKTPLFKLNTYHVEIINKEDNEVDSSVIEEDEYLPTIFVDYDERSSNEDFPDDISIFSANDDCNNEIVSSLDLPLPSPQKSPVSAHSSHSSEIISLEENTTQSSNENIDSYELLVHRLRSYNNQYINGKIEDILNQNISMKDYIFLLQALEKQQKKYIPSRRKTLTITQRNKQKE